MSDAEGGDGEEAPEQGDPFAIPSRPERHYPHGGGLEYEGETLFALAPDPELSADELQSLVEDVLAEGPYTYGDWFDLPVPLYTVHDEETGDVFRVVVRDGQVELHVLPFTESPGLEAAFDRIAAATPDHTWTVECHVEDA
jgi:hypothetical protein